MSPGGKSLSMQQVVEGKGEGKSFAEKAGSGWSPAMRWKMSSQPCLLCARGHSIAPILPQLLQASWTLIAQNYSLCKDLNKAVQQAATAQVCKLFAHHRTVSFDHIFEGSQQVIWAFLADW